MKSELYNTLYLIISNLAIIGCFIPLGYVIIKKYWKEKVYVAIALYWVMHGMSNIRTLLRLDYNYHVEDIITLINNMVDAAIMLFVFYLAFTGLKKKILGITIIAFIVFELAITLLKGFNFDTSTIIIAIGLILVVFYSVLGTLDYLESQENNAAQHVMIFVYAAALFMNGSFVVIFVFNYLSQKGDNDDIFLLYYISLLIGSIVTSYGLLRQAKPKPQNSTRRAVMDGFE